MSRERMLLIGLGALVVIGLIFGAVSNVQQNAWMEGYTIGRLTAAAGETGAVAPVVPMAPMAQVAPYAYGYPSHGPGFGGFFFMLLIGGLIFFVVTRFVHMARWRAWAMQGGPQGEWRQGPPWMHGPKGHGCWGQEPAPAAQAQAVKPQPAQPQAAQPAPDVQPASER